MPLSQLDQHAALVVVDLRNGMSNMPGGAPIEEVLARSADLAASFRKRGWPVVLVSVAGGAPGRTDVGAAMKAAGKTISLPPNATEAADVLDQQPQDIRIIKHRWGAFSGTSLHEDLNKLGVTQVFVVGVATSIGVESTARAAFELGYNVVLVADAMSDIDPATHDNCIERIFPRLGEVTTYADVVKVLEGDGESVGA